MVGGIDRIEGDARSCKVVAADEVGGLGAEGLMSFGQIENLSPR